LFWVHEIHERHEKDAWEILYKDESYRIQGAVFEVYRELGCGFLEAVYQECLEKELSIRNMPFVAQQELRLTYKGEPLRRVYLPDLVCYKSIIVEIKALFTTTGEHTAQVLNYLKATGIPLGLLVNFGCYPKATVKRIVLQAFSCFSCVSWTKEEVQFHHDQPRDPMQQGFQEIQGVNMARVFISFLGTNDYVPCTYYREGFQSENVRFVQEATIRFSCSDWRSEDRILIFTTKDAYEKNWLDNGHQDHKTRESLSRTGLRGRLSGFMSCPVKRVDIPDGKSKAEIWQIFNIVFGSLKKDDEVIFDITHAFRSIPMLAIVILNYAKVLKNVMLKAIYYGAFEVLGNPFEAINLPIEKRKAPIHDLTAFNYLLDWTIAVDRFVEAGDASLINTLARGGLKQILAESKGKDRNAAAIRDIGQTLGSYCQAMTTCRAVEIHTIAEKLKSQMKQCENADLLPPFQPLFALLGENMASFKGDGLSDGIAAANWCLEHNLIQQGATILREVVITYLISFVKGDVKDSKERDVAAFAINIAFNDMICRESEKSEDDFPETTEAYLRICHRKPGLVKIWGPLAQLRNDLNHAGYVNHPKSSAAFAKQLPGLIHSLQDEIGHLNSIG